MISVHHIFAVLGLPSQVTGIVKKGQNIVQSMTGNTLFPSPTPALSVVTTDLTALDAAEVLAATRTKGTTTARNAKLRVVRADLRLLKAYVQAIADASLPDDAARIIESAGMATKQVTLPHKAPIAVKKGPVSGTVVVTVRAAAPHASYDWGWSLDQKTWTSVPSTLKATTLIEGLTPGSTVFVRNRALTPAGVGDWGTVVSIIVT